MRIGILSDSHNHIQRTRRAVELLVANDVEILVHCGDLACEAIVRECAVLPFYFVFGNHDADVVPELRSAATNYNATCLNWAGEFSAGEKRIAVAHGHLHTDVREMLATNPDVLLSGHSHVAADWNENGVRRINPGALFRVKTCTVAVLDTASNELTFIDVPK